MNIRKIVNNKIVRKIIILGCSFLSFLNIFIPKKKNRVLFYDSMGETFYDNSRTLFEFMKDNNYQQKYEIVCCIPSFKNYIYLKEKNIKVVGVIKGVYYFLTSKYMFYSYASMRIKPTKQQIVVNQWHGTPLKRIANIKKDKVAENENRNYFTYTLSASDYFIDIMAEAFNCTSKQILVLGHTRNDLLFSKTKSFSLLEIEKEQYAKTILWMPTFRVSKDHRFVDIDNIDQLNNTMLPLFKTEEEIICFNEYLKAKNIFFVIKTHTYSVFKKINYSNIAFYTSEDLEIKGIQLYEFVKEFDALLTDYSSIYFDYLLLDRPIGFTVDDYNSYNENRGFSVENALDFMPGHHIHTIEELLSFCDDVIDNKDNYKEKRNKIKNLSNKYQDNNNCLRLLKYVDIQL